MNFLSEMGLSKPHNFRFFYKLDVLKIYFESYSLRPLCSFMGIPVYIPETRPLLCNHVCQVIVLMFVYKSRMYEVLG